MGGWGCAGARAGAGCACLRVRACVTCVRDARGVMLSARVRCVGVCYPIRAPMWFIVYYHRLRLAGKNNLFIYQGLGLRWYHYTALVG